MAVIGICGLIAIGAISILLAEEFKAWAPRLINLLIRRAVRKLPDETRTRYGEEWRSHICEIPGTIGKVLSICSPKTHSIGGELQAPSSAFAVALIVP